MAYILKLHQNNVQPYLRDNDRLSRQDRIKLYEALHDLKDSADSYITDEDRRLSPGSHYFKFDIVLLDAEHRLRHFWFAVSDAAIRYGVLLIDYVDEADRGPSLSD